MSDEPIDLKDNPEAIEQFWLVVDEHGYKNFRVTVTQRCESFTPGDLVSITGIVEEVTSWSCDDDSTPCEFEKYLSFYMKWDECCHINFGEDGSPGYLHLCGSASWRNHSQLMTELYEWASNALPMRL